MSIAARLKELRTKNGLTQAQLADSTQLTRKAIVNYENGYREPNARAMAALEQYFGVTGAYLRGETDDPEPRTYAEDPEMMATIREGMLPLLGRLYDMFKDSPADVQEHLNALLCELSSAMRCKDEELREMRLRLMRECLMQYMFFAQHAKAANYETGAPSLDSDRHRITEAIDKVLLQVQDHYRDLWEQAHGVQ